MLNQIDPITGKKYSEVTVDEWFNGNPFSIEVYNRKYKMYDTETPPMTIWRCCQFAAQAEESMDAQIYWAERWFKEIVDDWWMPAGSILSSAGNKDYKISLMNCTGLEIEEDTLEAIASARGTVQRMAACRQGIGINFSNLRPRDALIKNSSRVSQGACHWMKSFDQVGYEVGQAGRIPALLVALSSDHLDIEEFINLKATDVDAIRNANISVMVTDRFMEAAEREEPLEISYTSVNETKTKTIYPHKLVKLIAKNMYTSGEPGIQFIDTISRFSNSNYVGFPVVASNACCFTLSDYNLVHTANGIKSIKTLFENDIEVDVLTDSRVYKTNKIGTINKGVKNNTHTKPASKVFYAGEQDCIRLTFNNGQVHEVSKDHLYPIIRDDNTFTCKKADSILKSDRFYFQEEEGCFGIDKSDKDFELGFLFGWVSTGVQKYRTSLTLEISKENREMIPYLLTLLHRLTGKTYDVTHNTETDETYIQSTDLFKIIKSYADKTDFYKKIPSFIQEGGRNVVRGYLSGLFTANGLPWTEDRWAATDQISRKETRVALTPKTEKQGIIIKTLLSNFGIFSNATRIRTKKQIILRGQDLLNFIDKIGFIEHSYNYNYLANVPMDQIWGTKSLKISKKEEIGIKPVYCLEQPETKTLIVNGIITHNSEQMLDNQGVCLLSSINMGRFSSEDYYSELNKISESVLRFLDNINTMELRLNKSASDKQRHSVESLRRVGCGITNSVEYLFKQGLDYNSQEGVDSIAKFVEVYCQMLYNHSQNLGKEKGNFKAFDREKFIQSPFIKYMRYKYGYNFDNMRNCALLSIAPSGSISTQFRNFIMSYGVEPSFGKYYWKRSRVSGKWCYYFTVPKAIQDYMEKKGYPLGMNSVVLEDDFAGTLGNPIKQLIDEHCDINITPMSDIDIDNKIDLLKKLYYNMDASISVTNNLSKNHSIVDVEYMIYKTWREGIKSFTCYPETGMRLGIIETSSFKERAIQLSKGGTKLSTADLNTDELEQIGAFEQMEAPNTSLLIKRDKKLNARVHKTTIQGVPYLVFIGFQNKSPYEVFLYKEEEGRSIPAEHMMGVITKKKSLYEYTSKDFVIPNIAKYPTGNEVLTTRFVSMCLRNRVSIDSIIDQLQKSREHISDFASGLMRVLRKYEAPKQEEGRICPVCGNKTIYRVDGCYACTTKNCNYQGACE